MYLVEVRDDQGNSYLKDMDHYPTPNEAETMANLNEDCLVNKTESGYTVWYETIDAAETVWITVEKY